MISNSGRKKRSSSGGAENDPFDRDYGFGYTDEGRPITGITDGDALDPQAEIFEEKGHTIRVDLSKKKALRICADTQHNLKEDETETAFVAYKCTNCPYGYLAGPKH